MTGKLTTGNLLVWNKRRLCPGIMLGLKTSNVFAIEIKQKPCDEDTEFPLPK
jgi:hypothetical protein